MPRERYTNAQPTTLNGSINNSTTTVVVADGSSFPTGYFRILVDSEIMFCSARSGNTLTVIRGQEFTAAAAHSSGVAVNHLLTAGALDAFRKYLLGDAAVIDTSDSLSADDDDFDDESLTGWTLVQGTPNCTVTEKSHHCSILVPSGTAGGQHYGLVKAKTPPAGGWIQCGLQMGGPAGGYPIAGLVMADGGTYNAGKQEQFTFSPNENQFFMRETNNWNSNVGQNGGGGEQPYLMKTFHLRLRWNSTNNYTAYCSPDGISWATVFNGGYGSHSTTITHVGLIVTNWGSGNNHVHSFSYFRCSW